MLNLIDTHCHLGHGRLKPHLPEALARAAAAGVGRVICAAGDLAEAKAAIALAQRHADILPISCIAGVHPHEAKNARAGYLDELVILAGDERNVAIGEIGLDYHYDFSPRDAQRRVFAEQLALARRLGKPVIIHTRESFADTIAVLRESGVDGTRLVFHSCPEEAAGDARALDLGAMMSFSGIVTFRKADPLRRAAAAVPAERLLVETDAPYLSPEPVRSMRTNEPANVVHVAACLAAVRGTTVEALAEVTTANAVRFFALSGP